MTDSAPAGFVRVVPGWNVWTVWQTDDLPFEPMMVGVSAERRLRIWIEDAIEDGAPGAGVSDGANPMALKGSQIQIIPGTEGLIVAARKEQVPGPAMMLNGPGKLFAVRFFNRGAASVMPWPHDENYLLEAAFEPSATSPITSGPAPDSLAGTVASAAKSAGSVASVVVGLAVFGGLVILVSQFAGARKVAA